MSDEIFFDGQRFISAAEASSAADLTRDYVARLCRDGKVKGRRIGKNWYVHEDSLKHFLVEQSHAKEVRRGQLSNERTKEYFLAHRVTSPTSSDLQQVFPENVAEASTEHSIPIRRIVESDVREARATKSLASHAMHVQRALQTKAFARGEDAVRFAPSMLATPSGVHEAVVRTLGHGSIHVPVHTLTPFAEFLQKFVAMLVAFSMTFGTYALVDPSYARFAIDSIQGSATSVSDVYVRITGGGASALLERSREKMFFAAENPNAALAQVSGAALAFIPDTVRNLARAVNTGIDDLVYAIAFPDSVTNSMALTPVDGASVSIEIAPYAQGTQNTSSSATLVQAPAAQSSAPVAQNSNGAPVTIVERRVETERIVSAVGGITEDYLNQRLNMLESQITGRLLGASSGGGGGYTTINNNYQMIAQSNNIDKLGSVAIDNSTFSGGTISGSAIENATITGTSFSGGSISATTLSASGASSFATTTISKLTVTGDTTLEGTLSIPGALSISSSTISLLTNTYATTSFISAVTASTTNLTWVNATGTNATTTNFFSTNASTTNATSTNLFATIGRFTSAIINAITTYGEVSAPSFSATSTTATSTFAGGILGTRVPTLSHTFGSWTIGASGANPFDASFVINPATAAGDTNLFAAAVGGSVKFLVDAEGDVFVNNLTSVGSVTLSTTTASTFTVEGNATFGDSISDITTVNGSLVVTGTTTASTIQGNFGIGTSTPWARLSVAGVAGGTSPLFTISSSTSGFSTSTVFHIDNNGRVGIGTSSPSAKFAVDAPIYVGGSGVTATSTFEGNVSILGLLKVGTSSTYISNSDISAIGNLSVSNATTTNLFSTTASSTNLFSTNATFGSLSVLGALSQTGLGTFTNGFVSQASSTVVGAFTTTGTNTFAGALNIAGAITSTAGTANTFPYASSTALTVSGTGYFGTASTSILTVSSVASGSLLKTTTGGSVVAATAGTDFENALTFSSPLSRLANTISIQNAAADGSTKGAASFTASDFDATTGNISLDYTNGQAASGSLKGFLTSADWTTFNTKLASSSISNSAMLAALLSDETGTGNVVLSASPTFTGTSIFANTTNSGTLGVSGLATFTRASSTRLSIFDNAYFGGSATTTIDSAGNLSVAGTLGVTGNTTLANATTTNLFSTTASSTNLFSTSASFGSLSVLGALTQTGLGTFQNGFVSQASSTVVGAFTNTGAATFGSTLAASGLATLTSGFVSQASSTVVGAFTTTGTNTFGGALNIAGAITSTASTANTFPYASSTALTVSGTGYFGTASTTNLTISGVPSSVLVTNSSGVVAAASAQTCTNQFIRSLSVAYVATCASVAPADLSNADFGDFTVSSGIASLDADTVSDSEIDYTTVTLADFTNDANYAKTNVANSWTALQSFATGASSTLLSVFGTTYFGGTATTTIDSAGNVAVAGTLGVTGNTTLANATTTSFAITNITNGLLSTNANGSVVATTSVGAGYITGTLGTINGTTLGRGDSITITAASSTLLANNNSWTSLNTFANASTTLLSGTTAWFTTFIGNLTGNVTGNASTATALQTGRTINGTTFDGTSNITITAASSTLLANNNTFSGANTFTSAITSTATTANTFPYASSTALTGTNIFSTTASTTNLTVSSIASGSLLKTTTGGSVIAATAGTDFENVLTFSSPLSRIANTISIQNAAADGSTKGAASFTASDFDATTGNISLDYTNGQAASGSLKGFLTSADWTTFNTKLASSSISNSAMLAALLSDETGTGNVVLSASPTFTGTAIFANTTNSGTLGVTGLSTLTGGFVSQASSTVVGAFTTTGTNTFGGALNIAGAITSTASAANTFPYASSTALSVSGTAYFGTASSSVFYAYPGSASAPSYSFSGAANTGMFLSGSNLAFSTGGSERLTLTPGGLLGIGTSTPRWALTVASSTGPQFALVDTTGTSDAWTFRNIGSNFYLATSSATATSTVAAAAISGSTGAFTFGSPATTTFTGGLQTTYLNVTGASATSSFANGIQLTAGCFMLPSGSCAGTGSGSGGSGGGQLLATYATSTPGSNVSVNFNGASGSAPSFSGGVLTLPSNTSYVVVETWGGGGAGGGGTSGAGGTGGTTCFGTNATACTTPALSATGGTGGAVGASPGFPQGGGGGAGSGGDINLSGTPAPGSIYNGATAQLAGPGGSSPRGGGGGRLENTGGVYGGGGGGGNGAGYGSGGGGGGYSQKLITSPSGTYYYTVGAGGSTAGQTNPGGAGGAGGIVISVYTTGISQGAIGSGLTGQIAFYNGSSATTSLSATSSLFIATSTYIGIGTTTPLSALSTYGNIFLDGASRYINFGSNNTVGTSGYGFLDNAGTLQLKNSGGSWTNIAGVGNTNSWAALQSFTNASSSLFSVTNKAYFGGTATTTIDSAGTITVTSNLANTFPYASSTALTVSGTGYFGTASTSNLTVSSLTSGRVPFITTAGAFTDSSAFAFDSSLSRLTVTNASTTALSVSGNAYFAGSGIWNSSGSIGVGTTSPYAKLAVQATAGQTNPIFEVASSSNSTSFFTITSSGNVGIGTTSPSYLLTVEGNTNGSITSAARNWSNGASAQARFLALADGGNATVGFTSTGYSDITGAADSLLFNTGGASGGIQFALDGVIKVKIDSAGNLGVGTSTPLRKFAVEQAASAAQFAVAYDTTRVTEIQTDSSGDLIINPSGDDVRLNDDNLWVCSGGSCPSGTPSDTGNLIVETKIGIGSSTPMDLLSISGTPNPRVRFNDSGGSAFQLLFDNSDAYLDNAKVGKNFVFRTSNSSALDTTAITILSSGKTGIGTTTPTDMLSVHGLLRVGANSVAPVTLGTATSTFNGDIKIIGKLDVGTIDPAYTIGGTKYATYGHSTVGIKEETVLKISMQQWDPESGLYRYIIDFDELERGIDLWLFYQITDFGKDWKNLIVSLTPAFNGFAFYEEDIEKNAIIIYSSQEGQVSARLIANRFDFSKWTNLRPDQDGDSTGTHVIEEKR